MAPATANPTSGRPARLPPPASGWISVLRFGGLVFFIGILLTLIAHPWLPLPWWKVFRRCVSIAAAISLLIAVYRFERRTIGSYGLANWRAGKRQLVFGVFLGTATLAVLLGISILAGACRIHLSGDAVKRWTTVLSFLPAALLVGVLEELSFRGLILQHLRQSASAWIAVAASSALYALVHVKAAPFALGTFLDLVGLFLLGSVLAISVFKTGQLYFAIGLHASLAYGVRVDKLFVEFPAPSWLGGTSRIVNGLPGWIALAGLFGIIIWWTQHHHRGGARHEAPRWLAGGSEPAGSVARDECAAARSG